MLTALAALTAAAPASAIVFDQLAGPAGCILPSAVSDCAVFAGLGSPSDVVSAGTHVYVSEQTSNRIRVFDRDPATGALTAREDGPAGCIDDGTSATCAVAPGCSTVPPGWR